jgi:3-isopropylmalate/(R)-2-methylmalate dehydratase small subunit
MRAFDRVRGIAAPLPLSDVNTDAIIPSRWLRAASQNLAAGLFGGWRYDPEGNPKPDFVLNAPRYAAPRFLVAGANFGCGSSREAAVWALLDFGIRCVVAPSFGDIFVENAYKNGLLPLALEAAMIEQLCKELGACEAPVMTVDLRACMIHFPSGEAHAFRVPPRRREALLCGADELAAILRLEPEIRRFQAGDRQRRPWIYPAGAPR